VGVQLRRLQHEARAQNEGFRGGRPGKVKQPQTTTTRNARPLPLPCRIVGRGYIGDGDRRPGGSERGFVLLARITGGGPERYELPGKKREVQCSTKHKDY